MHQLQQKVAGMQSVSEVELNEFMLRMIEVLNKRFGSVTHQINEVDRKAAASAASAALKSELESLREEVSTVKGSLVAKLAELESELRKMKEPKAPEKPKINQNILKHLE